jgi:hypothetical protein
MVVVVLFELEVHAVIAMAAAAKTAKTHQLDLRPLHPGCPRRSIENPPRWLSFGAAYWTANLLV